MYKALFAKCYPWFLISKSGDGWMVCTHVVCEERTVEAWWFWGLLAATWGESRVQSVDCGGSFKLVGNKILNVTAS